ncbi:MAG: serine hydrolase [Planctomycetes bacterium]|nr:serine hydrolase [Planctomycetota bacterium]
MRIAGPNPGFLFALLLTLPPFSPADEPASPPRGTPLEAAARAVADHISAKPKGFAELFDSAFLAAVPPDRLRDIFRQLHEQGGRVVAVTLTSRESDTQGRFAFEYEKKLRSTVTLTVAPTEPHLIVGLFFGPPVPAYDTFESLVEEMKTLSGRVSFRTERLGEEGRSLAELNPDEVLAIGSTFKIYILGALIEDRQAWEAVIRLDADLMSLPSGTLQSWPAGSPVTIHTLAAQMISLSDNTATDHLLHHSGRERVERIMKEMGNLHAGRSTPFLSTLEMFKLKSDESLRTNYLAADVAGKRDLLAGAVKARPRSAVGAITSPRAIDTLEWFASAAELCRAMDWLRRKNDPAALSILAINPGLDVPAERFSYTGFKGGSEPGVLNLTFLIQSNNGEWFAVSGGWNDPERSLDEARFAGLIQGAIDLIGRR